MMNSDDWCDRMHQYRSLGMSNPSIGIRNLKSPNLSFQWGQKGCFLLRVGHFKFGMWVLVWLRQPTASSWTRSWYKMLTEGCEGTRTQVKHYGANVEVEALRPSLWCELWLPRQSQDRNVPLYCWVFIHKRKQTPKSLKTAMMKKRGAVTILSIQFAKYLTHIFHLIMEAGFWGRYYYSHFTEEVTEV